MSQTLVLPSYIDLQGHRGCRGLMPENTIPAFIKALELGVTTLEMDTVISRDKQVIVSHDPFMSHEICLTPNGKEISESEEKDYNIHKMTVSEITDFDCGSKIYPRFPQQQKLKVHKPLLVEVIETAERFAKQKNLPAPLYNIEIKSVAETDNIFHPAPDEFSKLVIGILETEEIINRTTIQCFDVRTLQYIHKHYPEIKLALLVENHDLVEKNLELLGFIPDIYSPDYALVNEQLMKVAKDKGMTILPWTVNTTEEAQRLIGLGVTGIITDYPNLFKKS